MLSHKLEHIMSLVTLCGITHVDMHVVIYNFFLISVNLSRYIYLSIYLFIYL